MVIVSQRKIENTFYDIYLNIIFFNKNLTLAFFFSRITFISGPVIFQ